MLARVHVCVHIYALLPSWFAEEAVPITEVRNCSSEMIVFAHRQSLLQALVERDE